MTTTLKRKFENAVWPCLAGVVIFSSVLLVFRGAMTHDFLNWDDSQYIFNDPLIRALSWNNFWEFFVGYHGVEMYWHPLTFLSHGLDYQIFHNDPWGHHLTSVVLHGLNTVLVFILFCALVSRFGPDAFKGPSLWVAGVVVALLFGWHPLRVESVAWLADRKDLLCTFFVLSSVLTYLFYAQANSRKLRMVFYSGTFILFIFSVLAKPGAVIVPAVLLLLDSFPLNRFPGREKLSALLFEKIPFFVFSLAVLVTTLFHNQNIPKDPDWYFPLGERILNAVRSLAFYIEKTFWPAELVPYYPFPQNLTLTSASFIGSGLFLAAVSLFCVWMWKKGQKGWLIVWLYYLVSSSPSIGIFQVGHHGAADRYTYLPTLSIYFLVGFGFLWIWSKSHTGALETLVRPTAVLGILAVLWGCYHLTTQQLKVWKNSESLWKYVIQAFPDEIALAHNNLGRVYMDQSRLEQAEREFKTALAINGKHLKAYLNLGNLYLSEGKIREAEEILLTALSIEPQSLDSLIHLGNIYSLQKRFQEAEEKYSSARRFYPDFAKPRINLGLLYYEMERLEEAERELKAALTLSPGQTGALNNLGLVYFKLGKYSGAEQNFLKALRIDPEFLEGQFNLGRLYYETGRWDEAEAEFLKALEADPNRGDIRFQLGRVYLKKGRSEAAEKEWIRAVEQDPGGVEARNELGVLYYETGRLNEAQQVLTSLLDIDPDYRDAHFNLGVVYFEMDRLDEAERELQTALTLEPDSAENHLYLGIVYMRSKKLADAKTEFQVALAVEPNAADPHFYLGVLHAHHGNVREAENEFRAALKNDPSHAAARAGLRKLKKSGGS